MSRRLFAARTLDRTREIAIRISVGSSRWRILRQVLIEALVISILGGVCAYGLACTALTGLASWNPSTEFPFRFFVLPQPSLIVIALLISDFRPSNEAFQTFHYAVSPGYFAASGTGLLAGRDVSFTDTAKTPPIAVVNQEFAWELFRPDNPSNAVGRYFKDSSGLSIQIVGIVPDGKYLTLSEDPAPAAFFPISQEPHTDTELIVRTGPDPTAAVTDDMAAAIRKVIRDLDLAVPIQQSGLWTNQLGLSIFPAQMATIALSLFGGFGLLLSIAGTFGLASYTVSKRLRELSIRVALGAQGKQIFSAALGRMLVLLGSGSVIGILLGVATSQILSAIVYQASAQDPFVLAAVALTILLTGSLSVAGPVRRALHVDPAQLLRQE